MIVKVGTFNLNNLFSRFNFKATISSINQGDNALTVRYEFSDSANIRLRTFMGRLVKAKTKPKRKKLLTVFWIWTWTYWRFRKSRTLIF
jgi:hypothetical protein